jgi:serine/threonine protein kinase
MSHPTNHISPDQLERFLEEQLSEVEAAALEAHLDACEACRCELESRAAEPDVWRAAREFLSDDGDADSPAAALGEHAAESIDAVLRGLHPTDDPHMLGRLGPYEIAGVVGAGGMGVVLKGFDAALDRYVAIKVLAPHLAVSGAARRRFAREARAAAAVVHENVIAIHAVAESHEPPYFVMPYVRGVSLEKRLKEQGPLGLLELLRISRQVAAGLAAAHAQGLVHRDIKPANILLAEGAERLQITDFGLARAADDASLTRSGAIAGTPQYMSPEQARGEAVDARSDLFSLGSVMYAMGTGHPPFRADTSYGILKRINETDPRPIYEINPEIPQWLAGIVSRLHAKDPGRRFDSAEQVAGLLEQCLAHVQQPASVPLPVECRASDIRRRPKWAAVAAAIAAILLVGLAASLATRVFPGRDDHPSPTNLDDAARWQDGLDGEIAELSREIEMLQRKTDPLWDEPALSSLHETIPSEENRP